MTATTISTDAHGVAIGGYDPVSYLTEGRAVPGSPEHTREWAGATWRFASEGHAATFSAEPERYAPAFGGHCAFGASMGQVADASPESWRVIDGRLCLMRSGSVRAMSRLFTGRIRTAMEGQGPAAR